MKAFEQAKWIFANVEGEVVDRYFEYQTTFEVDDKKEVMARISAYTQYAVYVNGQFVDCGQYHDYEDMKFYDTFPITDFVREGGNELFIKQYVCGANFFTNRKQIPGVIFDVCQEDKVLLLSDTTCKVREDKCFANEAENITPQLGFNFNYDANGSKTEWTAAVEVQKTKELLARPVKKLIMEPITKGKVITQGVFKEWNKDASKARRAQHAYLSTCDWGTLITDTEKWDTAFSWQMPVGQDGDGVYFLFDLGGESTGLLDFSMNVPKGTEVLISFGEHLDDLRVRSAVGPRNFTFRYVAKEGENTFFYPFQRLGLRYLQVMIYSPSGRLDYMGVRKTMYPITYKEMTVKDGLHKMIWETGRNTLHLCMHEHYEDCPWREQSQYGMDSRVQILCGYYAFGEYTFPKETFRMMAHSLKEDNFIVLCPPGDMEVNIPSFTCAYVREVLEYIEYANDKDFAVEMFPTITRIAEGLKGHIKEDGLLWQLDGQWNFYEWKPGLDADGLSVANGCDCLLNAFAADTFYCYSQIAKIAGEEEKAEEYAALSKTLKETTHKAFWREELGGYITFLGDEKLTHDLTQAMMLYTEATPDDKKEVVAELIKSGTLIPCTLSMTIFAYEGLLKVSRENHDYINKHIEEVWSKMLRSNTDTFWETAEGADDFQYAGSLCHGWSAVPIYIWGKYGEYK